MQNTSPCMICKSYRVGCNVRRLLCRLARSSTWLTYYGLPVGLHYPGTDAGLQLRFDVIWICLSQSSNRIMGRGISATIISGGPPRFTPMPPRSAAIAARDGAHQQSARAFGDEPGFHGVERGHVAAKVRGDAHHARAAVVLRVAMVHRGGWRRACSSRRSC